MNKDKVKRIWERFKMELYNLFLGGFTGNYKLREKNG